VYDGLWLLLISILLSLIELCTPSESVILDFGYGKILVMLILHMTRRWTIRRLRVGEETLNHEDCIKRLTLLILLLVFRPYFLLYCRPILFMSLISSFNECKYFRCCKFQDVSSSLENYWERSVNGKPDFLLIITSKIHLSLNLLIVWCT